ncbi:MAG: hypothetical protein WB615_14810 [Candidatus Tumulicola sp.]
MKVGIYIYAVAAVAAGIINLVWGDFATDWQPIQAFGDHVPGREIYAYITALWLLAGGAAMLWRRTARGGAVALAVVYAIFGIFWLPRFYYAYYLMAFKLSIVMGIADGFGQQLVLVAAGIIAYASLATRDSVGTRRMATAARVAFALSTVVFGVAHFTSLPTVAALVPAWVYPSGAFWAIVTGIGFVLAGIAILTGFLDVLGARLLTLMLAIFSAVVWISQLFTFSHDHSAWGGNAYNLAAVGAAWIVGAWLAETRNHRRKGPSIRRVLEKGAHS